MTNDDEVRIPSLSSTQLAVIAKWTFNRTLVGLYAKQFFSSPINFNHENWQLKREMKGFETHAHEFSDHFLQFKISVHDILYVL